MTQKQSHFLGPSGLWFDLRQGGTLKFLAGTGIQRDGGIKPQSQIPHSAYVMKACVVLIAIHLSDGNVKPDTPSSAFR